MIAQDKKAAQRERPLVKEQERKKKELEMEMKQKQKEKEKMKKTVVEKSFDKELEKQFD